MRSGERELGLDLSFRNTSRIAISGIVRARSASFDCQRHENPCQKRRVFVTLDPGPALPPGKIWCSREDSNLWKRRERTSGDACETHELNQTPHDLRFRGACHSSKSSRDF